MFAAYGAVYVLMALVWLRVLDGVPLTFRVLMGVVVVLAEYYVCPLRKCCVGVVPASLKTFSAKRISPYVV